MIFINFLELEMNIQLDKKGKVTHYVLQEDIPGLLQNIQWRPKNMGWTEYIRNRMCYGITQPLVRRI